MLYVYRCRKTYNGFTQWATASILNSLGMAFLSMRDFFPDFITVVIANTLLIMANGFIAYGLEIFVGSTKRTWMFISFVLSVFVLFMYFTYYSPNVNARIVIISVMLSILNGYCACIILRYVPRFLNDKNMLLSTVFSIQAIWFAFRIISTVLIEGPIIDFMKSSAVQGVSFIVFFGGNIFIIIGLIILNFQRVEFDLLTAMKEVKILRGIIPICSSCKKIRNDEGIWNQIDVYIRDHSEAELSHSICPECMKKLYPQFPRDDEQTPSSEQS